MHGNYCKPASGAECISLSLPTLISDRGFGSVGDIHIRRFRLEDSVCLSDAIRESSEQLCVWMTWCRLDYSLEDCHSFIVNAIKAWDTGREFSFAIIDSADGALLGSVGINQVNRAHNFANLGYWVRRSRTRQGIASAAVRLAAKFGFQELGFNRLELLIPTKNSPSQRVALKAGARQDGVLRRRLLLAGELHDAVLYSLLPQDLQLQQPHFSCEQPVPA